MHSHEQNSEIKTLQNQLLIKVSSIKQTNRPLFIKIESLFKRIYKYSLIEQRLKNLPRPSVNTSSSEIEEWLAHFQLIKIEIYQLKPSLEAIFAGLDHLGSLRELNQESVSLEIIAKVLSANQKKMLAALVGLEESVKIQQAKKLTSWIANLFHQGKKAARLFYRVSLLELGGNIFKGLTAPCRKHLNKSRLVKNIETSVQHFMRQSVTKVSGSQSQGQQAGVVFTADNFVYLVGAGTGLFLGWEMSNYHLLRQFLVMAAAQKLYYFLESHRIDDQSALMTEQLIGLTPTRCLILMQVMLASLETVFYKDYRIIALTLGGIVVGTGTEKAASKFVFSNFNLAMPEVAENINAIRLLIYVGGSSLGHLLVASSFTTIDAQLEKLTAQKAFIAVFANLEKEGLIYDPQVKTISIFNPSAWVDNNNIIKVQWRPSRHSFFKEVHCSLIHSPDPMANTRFTANCSNIENSRLCLAPE